MSRDRRQRESRRRSRRAPEGDDAPEAEPVLDPDDGFVRSSLPAAISGEVDEFDAALVRGAGGAPAPLEDETGGGTDADALDDERDPVAAAGNGGGKGGGRDVRPENPFGRDEDEGSGLPAPREHAGREAGGHSLPSRAVAFGQASWAELQRVQWPDREHVFQATAVVLGFVAVAGVYLFAADWVAEHIIKAIL